MKKRFIELAGLLLFSSLGFVSCEESVEKNTLSVAPSATIEFNASGNPDVTMVVTTDADSWDFTAPEWVIATKTDNQLVVNVTENTTADSKAGRIRFTAGSAEPVNVNVLQNGASGGGNPGAKVKGSFVDESGETDVTMFAGKDNALAAKLKFTLESALAAEAEIEVVIDEEYLAEYDYAHKTTSTLLPEDVVTTESWMISLAAGETEAELDLAFDCANLEYAKNYLLPLTVKVVSGNVTVVKSASRVNYTIVRQNPKEIKQLVCIEFNDTNPLNVLEWKLEDGSYFFDALVLFSGNIGWYPEEQAVKFNMRQGEPVINKNTDALVKEWETYIKPIHDAGIKVYMGLMPHHTYAGLTNLSYNGCKWFAEEMAEIIKDCSLDGVFLDEEYTGTHGGPMSSEWSTPRAGGAYFAYQMKKQMAAVVPWPTEVSIFQYGGLSVSEVTDHETGEKVDPVDFCDIVMPNYGGSGRPAGKQTLKNCCGTSIELARGGYLSESSAKSQKDNGYGWIAWFAWDPITRSGKSSIQNAARGCYGQELQEPTGYYKKVGEGKYDPKRYEY